ncbi:MAG: Smr/MutS family protein [Leucothrix sp.]|mgnify:CR=1 FL=1
MTKKGQDNVSDESLFLNAVSGVERLSASNKVELRPKPLPPKLRPSCDDEREPTDDMLSDSGEMEKVLAETTLSHCRSGIQNRLFRKLRQGKLQITEELDLHGLGLKQAKQVLLDFIQLAYPMEGCCVCIVHGKNNRSQAGHAPVMKQHVNYWLQQHPRVLAFHSAQPRDGGTGSIYAILKR